MLIFIPAITMSIWAEERRQGTDELLLTLPAGDFDIVVGKYLAAAAIFTASLLFSQLCNFVVLSSLSLGDLDVGLFFSTYLGYWLVGMAMLSVGMVASFLTSNLTVGFILGALFNAPLVFAANADLVIPSSAMARLVASWSLGAQFDDFGRGVISLASVSYFVMVAVLGLYLSMVLIGSRHWSGGRDGTSLLGHFLVRTVCLIVVALGGDLRLCQQPGAQQHPPRHDARASRLVVAGDQEADPRTGREAHGEHRGVHQRPGARDLRQDPRRFDLDVERIRRDGRQRQGQCDHPHSGRRPGGIDRDRDVGRGAVRHPPTACTDPDARNHPRRRDLPGRAFTCGLEKVVVPFFDYGVPVEYELIRSICTVARAERKRVGVVRTPAQLFGGFTFAGGQPRNIPKQAIIEELEKQYDVVEIDANNPIETENIDVMMVVQPSSLSPEEFDNVLDAIREWSAQRRLRRSSSGLLDPGPGHRRDEARPRRHGRHGWHVRRWRRTTTQRRNPETVGSARIASTRPDRHDGPVRAGLGWQRFNPYPKLQIQGIPTSGCLFAKRRRVKRKRSTANRRSRAD
jgi:ABC-2 type transport system permease protein